MPNKGGVGSNRQLSTSISLYLNKELSYHRHCVMCYGSWNLVVWPWTRLLRGGWSFQGSKDKTSYILRFYQYKMWRLSLQPLQRYGCVRQDWKCVMWPWPWPFQGLFVICKLVYLCAKFEYSRFSHFRNINRGPNIWIKMGHVTLTKRHLRWFVIHLLRLDIAYMCSKFDNFSRLPRVDPGQFPLPLILSLPHLLLYLLVSFPFPFSPFLLSLLSCFFIPSHSTRIVHSISRQDVVGSD